MKKVVKKTGKKVIIDKKIVKKVKEVKGLKGFKWAVVILAVMGLLYYFKASFIVAWVNNQPVWKTSYSQELDRLAGKQALESLMIKSLIKQEAKKQAVTVAQEEIDEELKTIEEFSQEQGMGLDDLLALQGIKKADLVEDIRLQKLVDKMAGTESAQIQEWIVNLQTQAKIINWLKD